MQSPWATPNTPKLISNSTFELVTRYWYYIGRQYKAQIGWRIIKPDRNPYPTGSSLLLAQPVSQSTIESSHLFFFLLLWSGEYTTTDQQSLNSTRPVCHTTTMEGDQDTSDCTLVTRKPCFGLPTACPNCLPAYIYLKLAQLPFHLAFNSTFPDSGSKSLSTVTHSRFVGVYQSLIRFLS